MAATGKSKVIKTSKMATPGGNGKMFGKQNANTMVPGQTAHKTSGTGGKGGGKRDVGKQSASMALAGRSGKN